MMEAAHQAKVAKIDLEINTDQQINFQTIDRRINSDLFDDKNYCFIKGAVTVPEEAVEEIIAKLKQQPNIISVNNELTKAGEKQRRESEANARRQQEREATLERIKDTHIEIFVRSVAPPGYNISYTEIDPEIIDLGTTGRPAHLERTPVKGKSSYLGPIFPCIFVPKESAEEIIEKLKKSQYITSVNGELTKRGLELQSGNQKNVLFSYSQYAKSWAKISVGVLGTVAVGLYLANKMKV